MKSSNWDNVVQLHRTSFTDVDKEVIRAAQLMAEGLGKLFFVRYYRTEAEDEYCIIINEADEVFCHIGLLSGGGYYRDNLELGYAEFKCLKDLFMEAPMPRVALEAFGKRASIIIGQ